MRGKPAGAANVCTTFKAGGNVREPWTGRLNARWSTACVDGQAAEDRNAALPPFMDRSQKTPIARMRVLLDASCGPKVELRRQPRLDWPAPELLDCLR